jgi:hypothetical protein
MKLVYNYIQMLEKVDLTYIKRNLGFPSQSVNIKWK